MKNSNPQRVYYPVRLGSVYAVGTDLSETGGIELVDAGEGLFATALFAQRVCDEMNRKKKRGRR